MEFKKKYWIGISIALVIILADVYLFFTGLRRWFLPIMVVAFTIGWSQFWMDFYNEAQRQKKIQLKFLEFTRNLVSNVKSGVSIPKAIVNVSAENYGPLTPYVKKLARQMEWGIPIHKALITFANDTENKVIKRSVSIIIEADESGGDIADILQSVADSMVIIKKMKEERKSTAHTQVIQGYIVFFVFIGIMLALQLWLFPQISNVDIGGGDSLDFGLSSVGVGFIGQGEQAQLDSIFFALIMIQGLFAGIMIGKFSEGSLKQGIIHSIILITIAALIVTTAKGGI